MNFNDPVYMKQTKVITNSQAVSKPKGKAQGRTYDRYDLKAKMDRMDQAPITEYFAQFNLDPTTIEFTLNREVKEPVTKKKWRFPTSVLKTLDLPKKECDTEHYIVDWNKNGQIAVAVENTCEIHHLGIEDRPQFVIDHKTFYHDLSWDPSGEKLATSFRDGYVKLWDVQKKVAITDTEVVTEIPSYSATISWEKGSSILIGMDSDIHGILRFDYQAARFVDEPVVVTLPEGTSQYHVELSSNGYYLGVSYFERSTSKYVLAFYDMRKPEESIKEYIDPIPLMGTWVNDHKFACYNPKGLLTTLDLVDPKKDEYNPVVAPKVLDLQTDGKFLFTLEERAEGTVTSCYDANTLNKVCSNPAKKETQAIFQSPGKTRLGRVNGAKFDITPTVTTESAAMPEIR